MCIRDRYQRRVHGIFGKFQIIGLTGGIATGKSTVVNYFLSNLPIKVIDCDVISRKLVEVGSKQYQEIVKHFGEEVLQEDKTLNRKKLSEIVFNSDKKRETLNKIMRFPIFKEIAKQVYQLCFKEKQQIVLLDAPLLYESGYLEYLCYPVMVVYCDKEVQVKRLCERDKCIEEVALKKINVQMPILKKVEKADIKLNNNGTQKQLYNSIAQNIPNFLL
eukprot:TRINITY_DN3717_c0_g1_i2.p2 TRINITY_DN3717_c0_g1~~TRINITY_DN3717_c0_g1_i2.p2  ORF type:complete len:218 (-),score=44.92 TRINITY_DN3717_c0_g1_i2:100-753(-)